MRNKRDSLMQIVDINAKTESNPPHRTENKMDRIRPATHGSVLLHHQHIKTHSRLHNPTSASDQTSPGTLIRRGLRQSYGLSLVFPSQLFPGWRCFRDGLLWDTLSH